MTIERMAGSHVISERTFRMPRLGNGVLHGSFRKTVGTGLMYLIVFEAAVLGSGQLLHLAGPITAKMLLFALATIYTGISLLCGERLRSSAYFLIISYLVTMAVASLVGILRDAPQDRLGTDISPLLSFLLFPFFEMTVKTKNHVDRAIRTIMAAAGVMTFSYIFIIAGLWTGRIAYADLADRLGSLAPSTATGVGDFMFDETTERVFYKGVIYLGIALIFFLFHYGTWAKVAAVFMALNLVLIGERGFFLALFITAFAYLLIGPFRVTRKLVFIIPVVLAGAILLPKVFLLAGDRSDSNYVRITTLKQVSDRTDVLRAVIGNGFGFGVPERPEHMEMVPVEVFYKQGIVGLCWWGGLFTVLIFRFRGALRRGNSILAYPFFLGVVFIAFESCTNPFINNPIGMTFCTLALACLGVLSRNGDELGLERAALPAKDERKIFCA